MASRPYGLKELDLMDAHLFRLFSSAAGPFLRGCMVEKIQEPEEGLLTLSLYAHNEKRQLYWSHRRDAPYCFLSKARLSANKAPSAQVMRIRKYFNGRRIVSAVFQYCQRKLWLLASSEPCGEKEGGLPWLCLDLIKGPSLHFLSVEEAPQEDDPKWPEAAELAKACEQWREWPILTPMLRKSLAEMDDLDRRALIEDLRIASGSIFLYLKEINDAEQVVRIAAWPLDLKEGESCLELEREAWLQGFERAGNDLVLRKFHENEQDRLLAPMRKRLKRLHNILDKVEQDEKRLRHMAEKEKEGLGIRDNLWRFDSDIHIPELELADGQRILLDKKYDLKANMERFFHTAKRGKRGLAALEERRNELLSEIANLEKADKETVLPSRATPKTNNTIIRKASLSRRNALQANLPKNVRLLFSTDGHMLLLGKDARGNRSALRLAQGHDLWVHVESGQGAHVIIRRKFPGEELTEQTLAEAASLAAIKSWHKDEASCSVMFAEARHVKGPKNAPAGKVIIDRLWRTDIFRIDADIEKKLSLNEG